MNPNTEHKIATMLLVTNNTRGKRKEQREKGIYVEEEERKIRREWLNQGCQIFLGNQKGKTYQLTTKYTKGP
jgi:hypothetical protein